MKLILTNTLLLFLISISYGCQGKSHPANAIPKEGYVYVIRFAGGDNDWSKNISQKMNGYMSSPGDTTRVFKSTLKGDKDSVYVRYQPDYSSRKLKKDHDNDYYQRKMAALRKYLERDEKLPSFEIKIFSEYGSVWDEPERGQQVHE